MGDKLADKLGDNFRPRGPDWRGRDDLGDKLADKLGDNLGPRPDWRQFCVTGFRGPGIVRGQSGRQTGGQTEAGRPDWRQFCVTGFRGPIVRGDKLADKLRLGGRIGDNSALQDSGAPGLSEDNLGDKLADKLGDNVGPEARIGDNSALQDSGAPGLSEDNLGDKLADKLGDNLVPEARIGDNYRIAGPRDCPRTIWATNWRTN